MKKALLIAICCAAATVLTSCGLQNKLYDKQTQSSNMVFDSSEFDDVAANFEEALQADPDFAQNYIDLADSYINAGHPDKAISVLFRGYDKTQDSEINNKIEEFFTKYSYDFVGVEEDTEFSNIFTLSEFENINTKDMEYYNAGIVLKNNETKDETLIAVVKLKGDKEWNFVENDLNLIGRHFNKLLINAYYGPGKCVSFIYDAFKNNITELESGLNFPAYTNGYIDCSSDFILAAPKAYDVESYVTLTWYDWDGNVISQIKNSQPMYTKENLYYIIKKSESPYCFEIYKSDYDGNNTELISTLKGSNDITNMYCYFWNEKEFRYDWTDKEGNKNEEKMNVNDLHDVNIE